MNRRRAILTPLVGLSATSGVPANAASGRVIEDDGTRRLVPYFLVTLHEKSNRFEVFFGVGEYNTKIPISLKPGSKIKVNDVELERSTERGTSTHSNYVPRAERLKFEILRKSYQHTIIDVAFPTFEANLVKPSWRYPDPLELKLKNAKGINPDSAEDNIGVKVLGDGSRLMPLFIMNEGERLESSESSVNMKTIPVPNSIPTQSSEAKMRILRNQRLAMSKLTTDYTAGWILMTYVLSEKPFKISV